MNHLVVVNEDKTVTLFFVLEPGNLHRLKQGQPITKQLHDFFPDGVIPARCELVLMFSEMPLHDAREFAKMSKVTFDERTPTTEKLRPHCPECKSTIEQLGVWRNESPMAVVFCAQCGSVFGMVPQEVAKALPPAVRK
jgi:Zn ribbon nucleic-acid-binding protein